LNARVINAHACNVKRIDIMESQAFDLARLFSANATTGVDNSARDEDTIVDEAELEQLADRVSAARSVY